MARKRQLEWSLKLEKALCKNKTIYHLCSAFKKCWKHVCVKEREGARAYVCGCDGGFLKLKVTNCVVLD